MTWANILVLWCVVPLCVAFFGHRKRLKEIQLLNALIEAYDKSDKVIKNCILYGELPLTRTRSNNALISCQIEHLNRSYAGAEFKIIMGQSQEE